jgi:hypothetical protein
MQQYGQSRSKNDFGVAFCPSKNKMASVSYSGTAKEPSYQISAHLVKVCKNKKLKRTFHCVPIGSADNSKLSLENAL